MWTQVRQWRQKRVLMRPEAAFPYVFAAEGAQHPPKGRHAQRPCAVIAKKIETNLSEDILVSVYYVRWSCVWNRLIARTGGLPPSLRSGRLRPERQVLQERLALQVLQERSCLQELRRLELRERPLQCRRPERVRVRFSRRGCRCTSGR